MADEDLPTPCWRPTVPQVPDQRAAHLRRQWQHAAPSLLRTSKPQGARAPIDRVERERGDLPGPQPHLCQAQRHRAVPATEGGRMIEGAKQGRAASCWSDRARGRCARLQRATRGTATVNVPSHSPSRCAKRRKLRSAVLTTLAVSSARSRACSEMKPMSSSGPSARRSTSPLPKRLSRSRVRA